MSDDWMLDTRVIAQHAGYTVHAQRHEVMFRDGRIVGLHPVTVDGQGRMFLRALQHEGLRWVVFDLRRAVPAIEPDLLAAPPRDVPGIVFYTLRGAFPTAHGFTHLVTGALAVAGWWAHGPVAAHAAPLEAAA